MADKEFLDYPKARVALGAGDLIDCFDVNGTVEDGETVVSTLRNNPAGSTGGKRKGEVTFKSAISEEGFERDYMGNWRKRAKVQVRIKIPGLTWIFTGRFTQPSIVSNVDGVIEFTIKVTGKVATAPA